MATSTQLVEVIDLFGAKRVRTSGAVHQLTSCRLERWGLAVECRTPDAPEHDLEITWLLPELGLRLTRFQPRSRHRRPDPAVLTAARIQPDAHSWAWTDLLLGLEIPDRGPARIIHCQQFAAAVTTGSIPPSDAEFALRTVHRALDELSRHHDIRQWLAHQGIYRTW